MLTTMPVQNCMHFLMPVGLEEWTSYDVPAVVGILRKNLSGQFEVLDAFPCERVPSARDLATHERYSQWTELAGGRSNLRFDVFLMPQSDTTRRNDVITLLQRSCGFRVPQPTGWVNAA